MKQLLKLSFAIALMALAACDSDKANEEAKRIFAQANDPFLDMMVEPQTFVIQPDKDTVVAGEQGTVIYLPKDAFVDEDGNVITELVEVSLAEAYSVGDMLLSNLTTTSNGEPLETDGMFYINAQSDGKNVFINPEHKPYIEIPTKKVDPDMMMYEGIRDADGNMNWQNPEKMVSYLNAVDIKTLDFLPIGFGDSIKSYIPIFGHKDYSQELRDSLYLTQHKELFENSWWTYFGDEAYLEPSYNSGFGNLREYEEENLNFEIEISHKKLENNRYQLEATIAIPGGKYLIADPKNGSNTLSFTDDLMPKKIHGFKFHSEKSEHIKLLSEWKLEEPILKKFDFGNGSIRVYSGTVKATQEIELMDESFPIDVIAEGHFCKSNYTYPLRSAGKSHYFKSDCGIQPNAIVALNSEEFNNTFIATKEFESRMAWIHQSCDKAVLDLYIDNLDKNLWEIDSMAAELAENEKVKTAFKDFAKLKQTTVKDGGERAKFLRKFYEKRQQDLSQKLEKLQEKAVEQQKIEQKAFEATAKEYRKLLVEREVYRMEKYGYELTNMGWKNIDKPLEFGDILVIKVNGWFEHKLAVQENKIDKSFAWMVMKDIKSLHRMRKIDASHFVAGTDGHLLVMPGQSASFVYLGFDGRDTLLAIQDATLGEDLDIKADYRKINSQQFDSVMNTFEAFGSIEANSIERDLKINLRLYDFGLRQKERQREQRLLERLEALSFPCCANHAEFEIVNDSASFEAEVK